MAPPPPCKLRQHSPEASQLPQSLANLTLIRNWSVSNICKILPEQRFSATDYSKTVEEEECLKTAKKEDYLKAAEEEDYFNTLEEVDYLT